MPAQKLIFLTVLFVRYGRTWFSELTHILLLCLVLLSKTISLFITVSVYTLRKRSDLKSRVRQCKGNFELFSENFGSKFW